MLFTIISILTALALLFVPGVASSIQPSLLTWIPVVGFIVLGLTPLLVIFSIIPLQRAQKHQTTFLLDLFKKDHVLSLLIGGLLLFSFLSIVVFSGFSFANQLYPLAGWIVLFGIALDFLYHLPKRMTQYLDSFAIVQRLSKEAKVSIANQKDEDLWQWMDALTEVGTKAVHSRNISLSNRAVRDLQFITSIFIQTCKSISREPQKGALGAQDEVSYTLFFLFDRLEIIFDAAVHNAVTPVCSHIISSLGKITLACAKFDMTLAPYPLHFLGKFALQAQERNLNSVAVKATITLQEVAKAILSEIDVTYLELQPTFLSLIAILEDLAKNTFKRDKSVSFQVLTQPFRELKEILKQERFASQQDVPVIIRDLDRVLSEFETLELVYKTMPPLSSLTGVPEPDKGK